jgi:cold shock CspA family protein
VKVLRHEVKERHGATEGEVVKLVPSLECGFIRAADGRDIYFHANSVMNDGWKKIQVGSRVRFAEEMGENGPQASTVHLTG